MAKICARILLNKKIEEAINYPHIFGDVSTLRSVFFIGLCVKPRTKLDMNAIVCELQHEVCGAATNVTPKTLHFRIVHRCHLSHHVSEKIGKSIEVEK